MNARKVYAAIALTGCLALAALLAGSSQGAAQADETLGEAARDQEPARRPEGPDRLPIRPGPTCEQVCTCNSPCYRVCREDSSSNEAITCGSFSRTCGTCAQKRFVQLTFTSPRRRNVQGKDGGHNERYCDAIDQPYNRCTGGSTKWHMDGLQLVPEKLVLLYGNVAARPQSKIRNAIEGPYQLKSGKWEWRDDRFNEWTRRSTILLDMYYDGIIWDGSTTHASSYYSVRWDELDPGTGNDDFDWTVNFIPYVEACFKAAPEPNRIYKVSTDNVIRNTNDPNKFFCDSRGCRDGEYEVRFDVTCTWRPSS